MGMFILMGISTEGSPETYQERSEPAQLPQGPSQRVAESTFVGGTDVAWRPGDFPGTNLFKNVIHLFPHVFIVLSDYSVNI